MKYVNIAKPESITTSVLVSLASCTVCRKQNVLLSPFITNNHQNKIN